MTKTFALAAILAATTAGCSEDADIGVDIQPATCQQLGGEVHGGLTTGNGYHHDFGAVTAQSFLFSDTGGARVQLNDNELFLGLSFMCGPAERDKSYDVVGDGRQNTLTCPYELYSSITGQIEILPAEGGVVLVDEGGPNSNCLAGRFNVDFGGAGSLIGWFSTPVPTAP